MRPASGRHEPTVRAASIAHRAAPSRSLPVRSPWSAVRLPRSRMYRPPRRPPHGPAPTPSTEPEPTPTNANPAAFAGVPTACYGLGEAGLPPRPRARRHAPHRGRRAGALRPGRAVRLSCGAGLPDRPWRPGPRAMSTLEPPDGAHRLPRQDRAAGTSTAERQDVFGVSLPPTSTPPIPAGPQPFTLGHCGLWSGVDFGGSWWDPIGFVDSDHGDADQRGGRHDRHRRPRSRAVHLEGRAGRPARPP